MSSFFEPPPPPRRFRRPAELPRRPWQGVPDHVIGRAVALNLVLVQSDKAAIWIPWVTAYPDVFEFQVEIRFQINDEEGSLRPFMLRDSIGQLRWRDEELDPDVLRLGIQLSDGRKATNLDGGDQFAGPDIPPARPILASSGSSGNTRGVCAQCFWVWPLPPAGPLAFVCEWPTADIPETRNEIDSALVRDAASDAVILVSDNESQGDSGS